MTDKWNGRKLCKKRINKEKNHNMSNFFVKNLKDQSSHPTRLLLQKVDCLHANRHLRGILFKKFMDNLILIQINRLQNKIFSLNHVFSNHIGIKKLF